MQFPKKLKERNKMTKEQVYNTLQDVADDASVSIDELVNAIVRQSQSRFEEAVSQMPEDSANYVRSAKEEKAAAREARRKADEESRLDGEVKRFRQLFPDVESQSIPENVWQDMNNGIPLSYAYALHLISETGNRGYADAVNAQNSDGALPPVNSCPDDGEISMEDVEAMSPEAVKKSFPQILRSLGKWKI